MRRSQLVFGFLIAGLACFAQDSRAAVVSLTPIEDINNAATGNSKDVFVYQQFGTSNFNNFPLGPTLNFGTLLAVANPGSSSVHHVKSLIDFDLTGSGATAANLGSAKLLLNVIDATLVGFPVGNATKVLPVPVAASLITSSWDESKVTFNSLAANNPTVGGLVATGSVSGFNQVLELDVTSALLSWLTTPSSQFGLLLAQTAEVRDDSNTALGAVFASSAFGSLQPTLQLTLVPEPATYVMADAGLLGALVAGLRRQRARRRVAA